MNARAMSEQWAPILRMQCLSLHRRADGPQRLASYRKGRATGLRKWNKEARERPAWDAPFAFDTLPVNLPAVTGPAPLSTCNDRRSFHATRGARWTTPQRRLRSKTGAETFAPPAATSGITGPSFCGGHWHRCKTAPSTVRHFRACFPPETRATPGHGATTPDK